MLGWFCGVVFVLELNFCVCIRSIFFWCVVCVVPCVCCVWCALYLVCVVRCTLCVLCILTGLFLQSSGDCKSRRQFTCHADGDIWSCGLCSAFRHRRRGIWNIVLRRLGGVTLVMVVVVRRVWEREVMLVNSYSRIASVFHGRINR